MKLKKLTDFRSVLREQLAFFEEQKLNFLDTYVSNQYEHRHHRKEVESLIQRYIAEVGRLVADEEATSLDLVLIGTVVTVQYDDEQHTEMLRICFPKESDPDQGSISFLSPIGSQLLLAGKGESIQVKTPNGSMNISIIDIDVS